MMNNQSMSLFSNSPVRPGSNGNTPSIGSGEPTDTRSNGTDGFCLSIMNGSADMSPVENSTAERLRMVVFERDRLLEEREMEM